MRKIVSYLSLIVLLVILFFTFSYISTNEKRLLEEGEVNNSTETIAYPKCKDKDVVVSNQLVQNVKNFSKSYVIDSVGRNYWNAHYSVVGTNFSVSDCSLTTYYEFVYGGRTVEMWVKTDVLSEVSYQISDANILLNPIEVELSRKEAKAIADEKNVSYDELELNLSIENQRYEYTFYKNFIGEGKKRVLVVDAGDGEVLYRKRISEEVLV